MSNSTNTVFAWIEIAKRRLLDSGAFFGHGTDNAADEAAWLVAGALGLPVDGQIEDGEVDASSTARLESLLRQRCESKIPTAYLLGEAWFAGKQFKVDNSVLIPRSPIAEPIADNFTPWLLGQPKRILDIGVGCGCIAVALAAAFADALVDAVDICDLQLAQQNISRHGLDGRINLIQSDLYNALGDQSYDLIVTNPPYVPTAEMAKLPEEYMNEPRQALHGGADGLEVVRDIVSGAAGRLTNDGWLVVETGHDSQVRVAAAFPKLAPVWLDLQNGGDGVWMLPASGLA